MPTVFTEKTAAESAPMAERTSPENDGAGYVIMMGAVIPVGGGPGGVTRRTSEDAAPLAETDATDPGLTERTAL